MISFGTGASFGDQVHPDGRLDPAPHGAGVGRARVEHHGRGAFARAFVVHAVAVDLNVAARGIRSAPAVGYDKC